RGGRFSLIDESDMLNFNYDDRRSRTPPRRSRCRWPWACVAFTALLAASPVIADEAVGFVLEQHGEWLMDGEPQRALSEGDELPPGATIRPKDAKATAKSGRGP